MTTLEHRPEALPPPVEAPPESDADSAASYDRQLTRATRRAFRSTRSIAAIVVAALLAALALLAAAEVISRLLDRPLRLPLVDRLTRLGRDTAWDDPFVLALAGAIGVVGLILLALALWPGRGRALPIDLGESAMVAGITRTGLRRLAAEAATTVDGISSASARARRRRVTVRVASPLHDPTGLAEQVNRTVTSRIERLALLKPPTVRVRIHSRRERGQ